MLIAVVIFVLIFVVLPVLRGSGHPGIKHEVYEMQAPLSDSEISIGVDAGDDGTLHLAWSTEQDDPHYIRSENGGTTWSDALPIGIEGSIRFLFVSGNQVLVFSSSDGRLLSTSSSDGGLHWSQSATVAEGVQEVAMARDGSHLYVTSRNRKKIVFRSSDDFGISWSRPQTIGTVAGEFHPYLSISAIGARVFCIWGEYNSTTFRISPTRTTTKSSTAPWFAESRDHGLNWSTPIDLTEHFLVRGPDYLSGRIAAVLATTDRVYTFFGGGSRADPLSAGPYDYGFFGISRALSPGQWVASGRHSGSQFDGHVDAVSVDGVGYLLLADTRYRASDWLGYTWLVPLNLGREWGNNDLIIRKVGRGKDWTDIVVTPPHSYVSPEWEARTRKILVLGDKIFAFWTGRKKVGQTLDAFGYKNQIFFAKFDL